MSANRLRIVPFVAYTASTARNNDDHISADVDTILYNVPSSNWQLLARYEHALLSTLANDPGHQARISLCRVLQYTTSLIYPNLSYFDIYTRMGDNFFPDRDTTVSPNPLVEHFNDVRAVGRSVPRGQPVAVLGSRPRCPAGCYLRTWIHGLQSSCDL